MSKKKILVIDDEENFGKMVQVNLEYTGKFEVHLQTRGLEALQTIRNFKPDAILLDVIMPDMSGPDIAEQIEKDEALRKIPVIFLTAIPESSSELTGVRKANYLFLKKPISTEDLVQAIDSCFGDEAP